MTPFLAALLLAADLTPSLDRAAPNPELNYLVLDVRSKELVAQRWPDATAAIPVGSLVKPFTALSFQGPYPEFECNGKSGGCWRVRPHGRLGFVAALAESCNAYFLQLAARVDNQALEQTAATFSIPAPALATPEARIGLGDAWRISPLALVTAYADLAARRGDPRVDPILAGLEMAARNGTAQEIGRALPGVRILAKTGTAPCVLPRHRHAGDGFALALYPADAPRFAILVRVHNVPGAEAARSAASLLKALRTAHN